MSAPSRSSPPVTAAGALSTGFHGCKQSSERQQDRSMASRSLPCWSERRDAGPAAVFFLIARQPVAQAQHGPGDIVVGPATAMPFQQCRRSLPERAGMNLHRQALNAPFAVELYRKDDTAAAGRRANLGATVLALQRVSLLQRSREAQYLRRVERRSHSRRQVVPWEPSSKTMPSALSSSRIRSAAAKSRF